MKHRPAYILGAAQGTDFRQAATVHNAPDYATSNFKTLSPRLYAMAGVGPNHVEVPISTAGRLSDDELGTHCVADELRAPLPGPAGGAALDDNVSVAGERMEAPGVDRWL